MNSNISHVRIGLFLRLLTLLFGIAKGIGFGVAEDSFKGFVEQGIAAHPNLHDAKSQDKIWRYAQRAHFHATGVGAFTLGLIILVAFTSLRPTLKKLTAVLIGIGGFYSLSWLTMYLFAPSMGRDPAHSMLLTETILLASIEW